MTIHRQSGGSYDFWIGHLDAFINEPDALMSMDMDGIRRFPSSMPCIIFDNLSVLYAEGSNAFIGMSAQAWIK
eukprot:15983046-Heterocapsa_arctica.AAC.1